MEVENIKDGHDLSEKLTRSDMQPPPPLLVGGSVLQPSPPTRPALSPHLRASVPPSPSLRTFSRTLNPTLNPEPRTLKLYRAKLEELCQDLFKKTLIPVQNVLKDAGMAKKQVTLTLNPKP